MSKKILLDGYNSQDIPYQCPVCESSLSYNNIVGWGEYPRQSLRGAQKPDAYGFGFICPRCFSKSCAHIPEGMQPEEYLAQVSRRGKRRDSENFFGVTPVSAY